MCGVRKRTLRAKLEDPTITKEWVLERLLRGVCEVTGLPLKLVYPYSRKGFGTQGAFSPSIDRKDPTKGYTLENSQVVVWLYNAAKSNGTHEDVVTLAEAVCRNR
jgi:hypothetical protein